jgi:hypothetical protein
MQVLYGIKISDRVTVQETVGPTGVLTFAAYFDGEHAGTAHSGRGAVNMAIDWLKARRQAKDLMDQWQAGEDERRQEILDEAFLDDLSGSLSIPREDIDTFIEIIKRKVSAQ